MVVTLNTDPETSCIRFVKVTNHKYRTELQRVTQKLEHFEKERKEREKLEQNADQESSMIQDEAVNLANKKPRIEEPSNFEQPSNSKMQ